PCARRRAWCRESVPRRCRGDGPHTDQKPTPFPWERTTARWCRPRGDTENTDGVGAAWRCRTLPSVGRGGVRGATRSLSITPLSSRKDDTARPYRPHSSLRDLGARNLTRLLSSRL